MRNDLSGGMEMSDKVDALVIFGATGDLAKIETFPALVGLVKRGVLDVPVIGVAKSGWGLAQFRDYATASLKLNGMDPADPAAVNGATRRATCQDRWRMSPVVFRHKNMAPCSAQTRSSVTPVQRA